MTNSLTVAIVSLTAFVAAPFAAASESCVQQAETIRTAQQSVLKLKAERDALVPKVEDAGDAWENNQAMRNFGAEQARQADSSKAAYEDLKARLRGVEADLQEKAASANARVNAYNTHCVPKD
ncbi:MAG TPA: hypothetical protein EYG02_09935 [Henriciella marina]|uniref:hypothetical protein n=1 Tax=Henriciella sp. TaxID=1968823 RepID=UPI00180ABCAA|nr:hypothetical protein [Henriciella sp.]HIG23472.1 hypothetical protein [Henriciella sp.]HIK65333.1 hypothetical protein [Henriciella marina]